MVAGCRHTPAAQQEVELKRRIVMSDLAAGLEYGYRKVQNPRAK